MPLSAHTNCGCRPAKRALVYWKSLCRRPINGSIRPALRARNYRSDQRRLDDDGDHDDRRRIVRTDAVGDAGQAQDRSAPIIFPRMTGTSHHQAPSGDQPDEPPGRRADCGADGKFLTSFPNGPRQRSEEVDYGESQRESGELAEGTAHRPGINAANPRGAANREGGGGPASVSPDAGRR